MRWWSVALVIVPSICGCADESPDKVFSEVSSAIQDRDRLRFEAVVDVEQVCEQCVDALIGHVEASALNGTENGFGALGVMLGVRLAGELKPGLVADCRQSVLRAVESGDLEAAMEESEISTGWSFQLGRLQQYRDKALREVVAASGTDTLRFNLSLSKGESDGWRIVGIDGLEFALSELADARTHGVSEVASVCGIGRGTVSEAVDWIERMDSAGYFPRIDALSNSVWMYEIDLLEAPRSEVERTACALSVYFGRATWVFDVQLYSLNSGALIFSYSPSGGLVDQASK